TTDQGTKLVVLSKCREHTVRGRIGSGPSEEDVRSTTAQVIRRAHDDVAEAIPVHVSDGRDGSAKTGQRSRRLAGQGHVRGRIQRGAAVIDERLAFVAGLPRP